jgi:hypothetical protein
LRNRATKAATAGLWRIATIAGMNSKSPAQP